MSEIKLEKQQYFTIHCDTFDVDISFFINYSLDGFLKEIKNKKKYKALHELLAEFDADDNFEFNDEPEKEPILGRMYPLKRGYAVQLRFFKDSYRINIKFLSHEISHLVSWILMDRRINLTKDNDEVYAYLTEEIMSKFLFKWY